MDGRSIAIDNEVFAELQRRAEPLVDDANSVLRRVLGLPPDGPRDTRSGQDFVSEKESATRDRATPGSRKRSNRPQSTKKVHRTRAPKGTLLPKSEYAVPLLDSLVELGGSAPASEVVKRVGKKLENKLTEADLETLNSGEVRWLNRVQFVRLDLIKEGSMVKDSPRGIWEVTDAGRSRVAEGREQSA